MRNVVLLAVMAMCCSLLTGFDSRVLTPEETTSLYGSDCTTGKECKDLCPNPGECPDLCGEGASEGSNCGSKDGVGSAYDLIEKAGADDSLGGTATCEVTFCNCGKKAGSRRLCVADDEATSVGGKVCIHG